MSTESITFKIEVSKSAILNPLNSRRNKIYNISALSDNYKESMSILSYDKLKEYIYSMVHDLISEEIDNLKIFDPERKLQEEKLIRLIS